VVVLTKSIIVNKELATNSSPTLDVNKYKFYNENGVGNQDLQTHNIASIINWKFVILFASTYKKDPWQITIN
jgi:hypothetical protein